MKRNTIRIIVSIILVHLLTACTPTDFMGSGSSSFNFESSESSNQQQVNQGTPVILSFESQFLTVKEGAEVKVDIKLDKASGSDLIVNLKPSGGEATLGEDYIISSPTIKIPRGSLSASFFVRALADAKTEQSETIFGELEVFQSDLVKVSSSTLSIIIEDSTVVVPPPVGDPVVSLITMSGVASEAQSMYQIPVVLSKMATQNVTVNIAVEANSTATLGEDFLIQGGNSLTILAGSQSAILQIAIIEDTKVEALETISLSLQSAVNATIGLQKQFQLSIMDNDAATPPPALLPVASIITPAASISEAVGNYNVLVTLDKPAVQAVSITLAIQGQTATANADFVVAQGNSLIIPAGQQSGLIAVSIINDTAVENPEIFNISLASAVGATLGATKSIALTIIDNDAPVNNVDPLVSLSSASGAASEGQSNYAINFNLNKVSTQNVTVMLTIGGTALQNQDYALPMGDNIVIPAGSLSASLPITIIDDTITEGTEVATFTISSVAGAKLGPITSFSFSIMDNDGAPVVDKNLAAFKETLYDNILRNPATGRCLDCHRPNGTRGRAINHSDDDPAVALQSILTRGLVNLDNPAISDLVVKVEGGHNAWSGSSVEDAALIASYIKMWADKVKAAGGGGTPGANGKISTNALMISEGKEVAGTARYTASQIAFYDFKKGADEKVIYDRSGVAPAVNLTMTGDIEWLGGQGVSCNQNAATGKAQASGANSKKLFDRLTTTNEYTIEAWISSTDKDQSGPTRIMSYSTGTANRNFTMGQAQEYFEFRSRNAKTGVNGSAPSYTPNKVKFVGDRPQNHHVVMIYDGKKRSLYVNGALVEGVDAAADANVQALNTWNDNYNFLFCNESSNNRAFKGSIFMAAVHEKALSGTQVMQNYESGFTKKLSLEFDVAEHTNPGAKLNVQVEVQGSYLFLNDLKFSGLTNNVDVAGIRFAVNEQEAASGQSYTFLENNNTANGIVLSEVASVIESKDLGTDKLSLHFQELGNKSQLAAPVLFPYEGQNTTVANPEPTAPSAVRIFSEVYQSMSNITGVSQSNANTLAVYNEVKSGLPTDRGLDGFTSSHQINIIKLSYQYCDEMVNDTNLRNAFYGNINTAQTVNAATKAQIADAVLKNAIGRTIATQASNAQVTQEVSGLVDEMLGFNSSTTDILKGACVLGIASMNNLVK